MKLKATFIILLGVALSTSCVAMVDETEPPAYPPADGKASAWWTTYIWPAIEPTGGDILELDIDPQMLIVPPPDYLVAYETPEGVTAWGWDVEELKWIELDPYDIFGGDGLSHLLFQPNGLPIASGSIVRIYRGHRLAAQLAVVPRPCHGAH